MTNKRLNLSIPYLKGQESSYVSDCIKSGWISSAGSLIKKFEEELCKITKSKYAVACINGTSALHISLLLAGVKKNNEVIVPTITFIAPVNAVKYCNANPIFMDCDEKYNLDVDKVIEFLNNHTYQFKGSCLNKKTKKIIKAMIIVHVWGNPINIKNLVKICKQKNIKLIEDSSESLGSKFDQTNKHTGTIGFCGCLSFNGNKIITTGGGGAILTQNKKIALKAQHLIQQAKTSIWFNHDNIGYNYRMINVQAAIGLAQIKKFNQIKTKKKLIYNKYYNLFSKNNLFKLLTHKKNSNNWMNVINIKNYNQNKLIKLIKELEKHNIETRPVWKPNHLQLKFLKYQKYKINKAKSLVNSSLCIPSSADLNTRDLDKFYKILCKNI